MTQLSLWELATLDVPAEAMAYDEDGDILAQLRDASAELYRANAAVAQLSGDYCRLRHAVRMYLDGKGDEAELRRMVKG